MCQRKRFAIAIPWQRVFNIQVMHINIFKGGVISLLGPAFPCFMKMWLQIGCVSFCCVIAIYWDI